MPDREQMPYRDCVGVAVFNADGRVFVGRRMPEDDPEHTSEAPSPWQMPQGGIDKGEDPEKAVFREMKEEIGTDNARIIGVMEDWVTYDIPERTAKKLWGGKYKGQKQKWIALEYLGTDDDIDLEADDHPEFSQWKWVPIEDLLDYVVPFKRDVYKRVMEEFGDLGAQKKKGGKKPPSLKQVR